MQRHGKKRNLHGTKWPLPVEGVGDITAEKFWGGCVVVGDAEDGSFTVIMVTMCFKSNDWGSGYTPDKNDHAKMKIYYH